MLRKRGARRRHMSRSSLQGHKHTEPPNLQKQPYVVLVRISSKPALYQPQPLIYVSRSPKPLLKDSQFIETAVWCQPCFAILLKGCWCSCEVNCFAVALPAPSNVVPFWVLLWFLVYERHIYPYIYIHMCMLLCRTYLYIYVYVNIIACRPTKELNMGSFLYSLMQAAASAGTQPSQRLEMVVQKFRGPYGEPL